MCFSQDGTPTHISNCPHCKKDLIRVENTTIKHKLYLLLKAISNGFWWCLDKIHLVRSSIEGRYDMFGDESKYVSGYCFDKDWNPLPPKMKKRKWWEYIIIEKPRHNF